VSFSLTLPLKLKTLLQFAPKSETEFENLEAEPQVKGNPFILISPLIEPLAPLTAPVTVTCLPTFV
jgi:hypothetical protein